MFLLFASKADYNNHALVDTNISLIRENFINSGKKSVNDNKIKENLKAMGGTYISYRYKIDDVKPDTRLQFYFTNEEQRHTRNYTKIDCDEFTYLSEWSYDRFLNEPEKKTINSLTLINIYCYMKMRIMQYENMEGEHFMEESVKYIGSKCNKGDKTVTFYLGILDEIGMITRERIANNFREVYRYRLNDRWREDWESRYAPNEVEVF